MLSQPLFRSVSGAPIAVRLVADHPRSLAGTAGTARVSRALPIEVAEALYRTATRFGVASGTACLAAFAVLLRKYTDQNPLVVGDVRVVVSPGASFARVLRQVVMVSPQPAGDLVLSMDGEAVHLEYDAALFEPATMQRLAQHYERVLSQVSAAPLDPVSLVELASAAERCQAVGQFNATARPYPRGATVHGLVLQQARRAAARIAVVDGAHQLTYGELAGRAGRLAEQLVAAGARRGRPVAVLLPRGHQQVTAWLAVLLAGGAYLPLDPRYPTRLLASRLADSRAPVLVTASGLASSPDFDGVTVVVPDEGVVEADPITAGLERWDAGSAQDLACLTYTADPVGRPRGVQLSHRGLLRLVRNPDYVDLTADTRILATTAPVFEVSAFEVWAALLNGGSLHLVADEVVQDAAALRNALAEQRITTMWITCPLFARLVEQQPAVFATLRHLLVGGGTLSRQHVVAALRACPGLTITRTHGHPENSVFSTACRVGVTEDDHTVIGRPVANSTAYVVDPDGQLCPVGVPGLLGLGGDGVARGYVDSPALTAAAFVPDGFATGAGQRLYLSGDLARWRADGVLELLGRRDRQIMANGQRVEPGEVEHALLAHPAVRAAVVVGGHWSGIDGDLCGYYVASAPLTAEQLCFWLAERLPAQLVPEYLVPLPALPLDPGGAVDLAALPEPGRSAVSGHSAPRDRVEQTVARLAEQLLGVVGIDVHRDLRDLGADSLTATRLAAGLAAELGAGIDVREVLRAGTVERLATLARSAGAAALAPRIPPAPELPDYPLSRQQRRLHLDRSAGEGSVHHNTPVRVDLPPDIEVDRLVGALHRLAERHEALRTEVAFVRGEPRQRIRPAVHAPVSMAATAALPVRPFDITRAPLWRAAVHPAANGLTVLMDLHQVIVDGLSLVVLFEDLAALYSGAELPPVGLRYRDYAHWSSQTASAEENDVSWGSVLAAPRPDTDLPLDLPRRPIRQPAGGAVDFELDEPRTVGLRRLAREHDTTLFAVLAAAYQALLAGISGRPGITVGTLAAGRTVPGLERTVGLFAEPVCLRSVALPELRFAEFLRQVDGAVQDAVARQDHPLEGLEPTLQGQQWARPFDALLTLHSARCLQVDFAGVRVPLRPGWNGQSPFELNLQVYETAGALRASWQYASGLLLPSTVGRWRDGLVDVLDTVLAQPETRLGQLARPAVPARLPDSAGNL